VSSLYLSYRGPRTAAVSGEAKYLGGGRPAASSTYSKMAAASLRYLYCAAPADARRNCSATNGVEQDRMQAWADYLDGLKGLKCRCSGVPEKTRSKEYRWIRSRLEILLLKDPLMEPFSWNL